MQTRQSNRGVEGHRGAILGIRRLVRDEEGASAVEFAFIGPIILVMMIAIIEFGQMMFALVNLQFTADQAGREVMAHFTREYFTETDAAGCYTKAGEVPTTTEFGNLTTCVTGAVQSYINDNIIGMQVADITVTSTVPVAPTSTDAGGNPINGPGFVRVQLSYNYRFIIPIINNLMNRDMLLYAETRVPLVWYRA